ncbi:MAG: hypothetical protein R2786_04310 [Flavobacteriaceae bacterium]
MRKTIYYFLLIFTLIGIPFSAFGVLNTMVSLKYETNNLTDCISLVSGTDLCLTINVFRGLTILFIIVFILLLIYRKKLLRKNQFPKLDFNQLDQLFDELQYQFSKGISIENYESGTRWIELEKVKEWKSRFGYQLNIYSNDHFIDNKPHFHFDNISKEISCKISFDGEIFESSGKKEIDRKTLKELTYFLSRTNIQNTLIAKWNEKNPKLKVKYKSAST